MHCFAQYHAILLSTTSSCSALRRLAQQCESIETSRYQNKTFYNCWWEEFWSGPKVISDFRPGTKNHWKFVPGQNSGTKFPWDQILASRKMTYARDPKWNGTCLKTSFNSRFCVRKRIPDFGWKKSWSFLFITVGSNRTSFLPKSYFLCFRISL